jgi:hypothetical protein
MHFGTRFYLINLLHTPSYRKNMGSGHHRICDIFVFSLGLAVGSAVEVG